LDDAYDKNFVGKNILSSSIDIDIYNLLGAGAYIVGEETAMLEAIEGKRGMPRVKPPFPAIKGLYGKPTIINNTETLATVPKIILNGSDWYKNLGLNLAEGVKIFSMSGHVGRPGNYEVPLGTPFSDLLEMAGGIANSKKLKAVIPGGSSVPVLTAETIMKTNMDYDSLMKAGSMLGSGGVIVMDNSTCMVSVLHTISRFYFAESCGQCTPCREGTGWSYRILERILNGEGKYEDLNLLLEMAANIKGGRCLCPLGDAACGPLESSIRKFRNEFEAYISNTPVSV